jgi:transcriptional regulator with XRE-family HTH domain
MPVKSESHEQMMKRFGEKLQVLRERRRLSLQQLADLLGVSKSFIWKVEQGQKIPNIAMLIKITDLFEVASDRLIRDELELDDTNSLNQKESAP